MKTNNLFFIFCVTLIVLLGGCKKDKYGPYLGTYIASGYSRYWWPYGGYQSDTVSKDTITIVEYEGHLFVTSTPAFLDNGLLTATTPCSANNVCFGGNQQLINQCIQSETYNVTFNSPFKDSVNVSITQDGCGLGGGFSISYYLKGNRI